MLREPEYEECMDDFIAPGPTQYLCTLEHGHEGDHRAENRDGDVYEIWARGTGRQMDEVVVE